MNVLPIPAFTDNYIWAITNEEQHVFMAVDPGEAAPVIHFANHHHMPLTGILLTHHHDDHIGGVERLLLRYPNIPIYGPADPRIPHVNHPVSNQSIVHWGKLALTVIEIPGHTSTHIAYYAEEQGWLFCGDTLFSVGCGRVFDGTIKMLYHSLQKLAALPDNTQVYCGHEYTQQNARFALTVDPQNQDLLDYLKQIQTDQKTCTLPSTIGLEKKVNPFLRLTKPAIKQYAARTIQDSFNPSSVFQLLRDEKNRFV